MSKPMCESCAMPIDKEPLGGGTNADGSQTQQYCSHCYVDGQFTYQGSDVKEFQRVVTEQMVKKRLVAPVGVVVHPSHSVPISVGKAVRFGLAAQETAFLLSGLGVLHRKHAPLIKGNPNGRFEYW